MMMMSSGHLEEPSHFNWFTAWWMKGAWNQLLFLATDDTKLRNRVMNDERLIRPQFISHSTPCQGRLFSVE